MEQPLLPAFLGGNLKQQSVVAGFVLDDVMAEIKDRQVEQSLLDEEQAVEHAPGAAGPAEIGNPQSARFQNWQRVDEHGLVKDQFGGLLQFRQRDVGHAARLEYGSGIKLDAMNTSMEYVDQSPFRRHV